MASLQQTDKQNHNREASRVSGGARVYAIGDIHGRVDLLRDLHRQIIDDAGQGTPRRKVLVYLGDYVDRGPHSFEVVDSLISDTPEGFETVFLKGNHEDMLLGFLEQGAFGSAWLLNGGLATVESYGVDFGGMFMGAAKLRSARQNFRNALPQDHLEFFRGLAAFHVEGDYLFAHAGVDPNVSLENQDEHDLMWIREKFLRHTIPFGKIVVHGHTIRPSPDVRPNRIGIDTGAYETGRLTCLVLEGGKRRFLQT